MTPPAPAITPVFLDTFTAVDGTDPTSRDMDAYVSGAARWTASVETESQKRGGIVSNKLFCLEAELPFTGAASTYLIYEPASLTNTLPVAIVLDCFRGSSSQELITASAYNSSGDATIDIFWENDSLRVKAFDSNNSGGTVSGTLTTGAPAKIALWTDGTVLKGIANGAEICSTAVTANTGPMDFDVFTCLIAADLSWPDTRYVNSIAYYSGYSLEQIAPLTET